MCDAPPRPRGPSTGPDHAPLSSVSPICDALSAASLTLISPRKAGSIRLVISPYHCDQLRWKLSVPACFICSSDSFIIGGGVLSQPAGSAADALSEGMLMRYLP